MTNEDARVVRRALHRREMFLLAFRGVSASKLCQFLTQRTPGVDFTGCPKSLLADNFALEERGLSGDPEALRLRFDESRYSK
jgi:hypothetical protein